jgi:hypothetical protein
MMKMNNVVDWISWIAKLYLMTTLKWFYPQPSFEEASQAIDDAVAKLTPESRLIEHQMVARMSLQSEPLRSALKGARHGC